MPDFDFDIAILGGGAAGLTVAAGAAQFGARTLLIEKEKELGGDCLHFGCVPSKTLIKTARVYHLMKNAGRFGLPPATMGEVDYENVKKRIRSVIAEIQRHDSEERFCTLGVKVEIGGAQFLDEHSVLLDGRKYSARHWVIATGSSPAVPPIEGIRNTPYITNKDIFSLDRLPASMITIGAGPIAIEMAQAFSRLGTKVTVLQRSDQILTHEDRDMADRVMRVLTAEGVEFSLSSSPLSVRDLGGEKEVTIKDSEGRTRSLRAERILVAVGRRANLGELGLEKISVDFDTRGLKVDSRLRTNHSHIFAAGDVTGAYQFTHAAGYEGSIVLSNAVLRLPRRVNYTNFPWCTYTDPELASIGMNEKMAAASGISCTVWTEEFRNNDRGVAEGEETGILKMLLDKKGRPIGVQILGHRAGDLIGEWTAVMNGGVGLATLASAVHPYPTLAEINKRVAGTFLSGKIFSEKVKKALKFFFSLKGRACGE